MTPSSIKLFTAINAKKDVLSGMVTRANLAISISSAMLVVSIFGTANAECAIDEDWPDKPCYDSGTPSKSKLKQVWEEYYKLKGREWMEMKKVEMDNAIENKRLNTWLENDSRNP